ncbi:DUF3592 domain-containing protein [uncultured Tenacibaculum sp.]|uniref:DUF3592 domain-containing protein n=1 Tax=uncultured Tenacibaculum sp. TaxID=174713 RepID=UPI002610AF83|nr:DUF3592 domain-containing protein [uncultured Tenacibaculum sp.]
MKSYIYILCFLFLSIQVSSQNTEEWIKTEGTIKTLEKKRRGKTFAMVSFTTEEGKISEAYIELLGLPIIGSFKSVGDTIEIYYDKNNPVIAKSESGKFLSQYGMIILIALGVIFSVKRFIDARKLQNS